MLEVSVFLGLGYIFCMLTLFSSNPRKKYYNQLFKRKTFLVHVVFALLLASFGVYRTKYVDTREVAYFTPLLFLIAFRLFDSIIFKTEGRHILVVTRGDWRPSEHKWWKDGLFTVLSVIIPFLLSVFILSLLKRSEASSIPYDLEPTKIDVYEPPAK